MNFEINGNFPYTGKVDKIIELPIVGQFKLVVGKTYSEDIAGRYPSIFGAELTDEEVEAYLNTLEEEEEEAEFQKEIEQDIIDDIDLYVVTPTTSTNENITQIDEGTTTEDPTIVDEESEDTKQ